VRTEALKFGGRVRRAHLALLRRIDGGLLGACVGGGAALLGRRRFSLRLEGATTPTVEGGDDAVSLRCGARIRDD
jgi:hypothetical protein